VTEGLLADCTRDELQAAAAHELAHIVRGDGFYVTLVCSLGNFLERIQAALEPEDIPPEERGAEGRGGADDVHFGPHLDDALFRRPLLDENGDHRLEGR
jgi:Zn-dependent protease with chaperone function